MTYDFSPLRNEALLNNEVLERVRETRLACFKVDQDECETCGKPILLGPCSDSDCPLEGGE